MNTPVINFRIMPLFIFLFSFILIGCQHKKQAVEKVAIDTALSANTGEIQDTFFTDRTFVLFLWPDQIEKERIQATYDKNSYNTFVDNMTWYTNKAAETLDSLHIENKIIDKDIIVLVNAGKKKFIYQRKKLNGNMIFFNPAKDPVVSFFVDFNKEAVKDYFQK